MIFDDFHGIWIYLEGFFEQISFVTCNFLNNSIVELYRIIMETYSFYQSVLDNTVKNDLVFYYQLTQPFNSGLVYEYDQDNTLFYDFFSFGKTLNSIASGDKILHSNYYNLTYYSN